MNEKVTELGVSTARTISIREGDYSIITVGDASTMGAALRKCSLTRSKWTWPFSADGDLARCSWSGRNKTTPGWCVPHSSSARRRTSTRAEPSAPTRPSDVVPRSVTARDSHPASNCQPFPQRWTNSAPPASSPIDRASTSAKWRLFDRAYCNCCK